MPELPEVEVVRRGLARWVAGRTIAEVQVHHPRAVRRHLEGAEHFVAALTGRTLTAAHRRGKYLWLPVAEADGAPAGRALVAHLGMSGQLLVEKPDEPDEVHLRARFRFAD
ncbi:MAG: mutM, partial [Modestobacter sp.]|nr:mutM [Modestobacter sp.]